MKQSDLAALILVVSMSLIVSFFVGNAVINAPKNRQSSVEHVESISSELQIPSDKVFVKDFINPTELIKIGDSGSDKPFTDKTE